MSTGKADERLSLHQFAHQPPRCRRIAPALHQHVEHGALLIHRSPQVVPLPSDREKHHIEAPRVSRPRPPAARLVGELLAKLLAPAQERWGEVCALLQAA